MRAKVPKQVARRTRLLCESVVHESNKSQPRESQHNVEDKLCSSAVTLISATDYRR